LNCGRPAPADVEIELPCCVAAGCRVINRLAVAGRHYSGSESFSAGIGLRKTGEKRGES
jgi:hypothetical protein